MPRISRTELGQLLAIDRRRANRCLFALIVGLVILIAGLMVAATAMNRSGVPLNSAWRTLPFVLPFSFIPAFIFGIGWLDRSALAKCPGCHDPFYRRMDGYYAIVSGRCPQCALTLFTDESAESRDEELPSPVRLTRSDIRAAERQAHRVALRTALKWGASGVVLLVAGYISTTFVQDLVAERWGDVWTPFVAVVLVAPGIAIAGWALAIYDRRLPRSASPRASCPHCDAVLSDVALVTGNCSTCGKPAVADPFPGMVWTTEPTAVSTAPWNVAEFYAKARYRRHRLWIGCLIGGGLAFLWALPFVWALSRFNESSVSLAEAAIFFTGFVGMISIQCGGVVLWHRFLARGLRCPECSRELLSLSPLLVSSQRCYHCGCRVLNEDEFGDGT
jgi:hypothetical protein